MSSENIHVENADDVRECVSSAVMLIEDYKEQLCEEIFYFDQTIELCEQAKSYTLSEYEAILESKESSSSVDGGAIHHTEEKEDELIHLLLTLTKGIERIESAKRDALSSLSIVEYHLETANGLKVRVDRYLDLLNDSR